MANILLAYSSTDGHTLKICLRIKQIIEQQAHSVNLVAITEVTTEELNACDKFVLGACIRYGKHLPAVYTFINNNLTCLQHKANAFFSVNVVARKPTKRTPQSNPYLKKFLRHSNWQPKALAVFAGKIDYAKYGFWDKHMIRFIMWLTHGPIDLNTAVEFTDWDAVDAFALQIAQSNY